MSCRSKPSGPCASPDTVPDPCSPEDPTTGRSWRCLNEEEEQRSEENKADVSFTHSPRDQEDVRPCGAAGGFRSSSLGARSCGRGVQRSVLEGDPGHCDTSETADSAGTPREGSTVWDPVLEAEERDGALLREEIRAVSVNGTLIVPEPGCHVTPLLRRPPEPGSSPALPVPLHCCGYSPTLDRSTTLISSFSRFPYPTQAELSRLTAACRHSEGQIRAWFSTQRLKQGITWAPEEVEEARKKMFNGSTPVSDEGPLQSNTTHMPSSAGAVPPGLKRGCGAPVLGSEVKRAVSRGPGESVHTPPPAPAPELSDAPGPASPPASLMESFIPPKEKRPLLESKQKLPQALPPEPPKDRRPLSPIVSTNLKGSLIHHQINVHASLSSVAPKNMLSSFANGVAVFPTPAVTGAAVFQSLPAPLLQNTGVVPRCGALSSGKHWPVEQAKISQYDSENTNLESSPRERSDPTRFPVLERVKDQSPAQAALLEESFSRSSVPSRSDLEQLVLRSGLSRTDLERWFLERRALRDHLERVVLSSMSCGRETRGPASERVHCFWENHGLWGSPKRPSATSRALTEETSERSRCRSGAASP